jgi:hypothetical protein
MQYPWGELPMKDKNWFYINPKFVIAVDIKTPLYYKMIVSMTDEVRTKIYFNRLVKKHVAYPRFDLEESLYKITPPSFHLLPDGKFNTDFDATTDRRSLELLKRAESYEKVYLFYSGGIDSTTILSAILKNWSSTDIQKLVVVMTGNSINENPVMYDTHIKGILNTKSVDESNILTNDNLYVSGDMGGALIHAGGLEIYDKMFPNTYNDLWKLRKDNIIKFFAHNATGLNADLAFDMVVKSLYKNNIVVDTVFDFLWWISFNWGFDLDIYYMPMLYATLGADTDTKQFMEENQFLWYNSVDYQNWAISAIGTNLKIGDTINTQKFSMKKYIHDFNNDDGYFENKLQEYSTSKLNLLRLPVGMDTEYNFYYRDQHK